jgi:hypothetical protein
MKYLCFIVGILFVVFAFGTWAFYGKDNSDNGFGYFAFGFVGLLIAGGGIAIHEKEIEIEIQNKQN